MVRRPRTSSAKATKAAPRGQVPKLSDEAEKLLDAANNASNAARNAWLAFLALVTYLLVTLGGVSHKDLLLNSGVQLPIVNIKIPLFSFFQYAPLLLLLVLLSLLIQHVVLAPKYRRFVEAIAPYETKAHKEHPARQLVHSYVVSQLLAGPKRNFITRSLMRLMVFVTFVLLPVVTLLYFQIKFMPYHEVWVTYWHRIMVLLGLAMLFALLPIIQLKSRKRLVEVGPQGEAWRASRFGIALGALTGILVIGFSWLIATIPGERLDRLIGFVPPNRADRTEMLLNPLVRAAYELMPQADEPKGINGEADKPKDEGEGWLLRRLVSYRVLVVEDIDMVPDEDDKDKQDEVSVVLREREFRFARLSRSDLHRADLTKADLSGALLVQTRLEKAKLGQAKLQGADLREAQLQDANLGAAQLQGADLQGARLQGAYLWSAQLQDADLKFAQLQGADLSNAQLQGASLSRAQLQDANLTWARLQGANLAHAQLQDADLKFAQLQDAELFRAQLQGADLRRAELQGANLALAQLQGANLSRAQLQGAKLINAELQGADLREAQLQGADLREAQLQGADLSAAKLQGADLRRAELQGAKMKDAQLQGADLRRADLQGANLSQAQLQGVDLENANLKGADLRFAHFWLARFPLMALSPKPLGLAKLNLAPLTADGKIALKEDLEAEVSDAKLLKTLLERLEPILGEEAPGWPDEAHWRRASRQAADPTPRELVPFLADLACEDSGGTIAKSMAQRAARYSEEDDRRAYVNPLTKALLDENCEGAKALTDETRAELRKLVSATE